jgi:hypothetical protein
MTFLFEDGQVKINMDGYIKNLSVDIEGKSTTPAGVDLFVDEETRVRPDILLVVNYLTTRVNTFTLGGGSFYSSSHKQKLTTNHLLRLNLLLLRIQVGIFSGQEIISSREGSSHLLLVLDRIINQRYRSSVMAFDLDVG